MAGIGNSLSSIMGGMATGNSAAVMDLGLGSDLLNKTQQEIDEARRRKKLTGQPSALSPAVMSLTGNQY